MRPLEAAGQPAHPEIARSRTLLTQSWAWCWLAQGACNDSTEAMVRASQQLARAARLVPGVWACPLPRARGPSSVEPLLAHLVWRMEDGRDGP